MAWKGIKHKTVGTELSKTEWEDEEGHELDSGTDLPETANASDLFYKTDEKRLYIYIPE